MNEAVLARIEAKLDGVAAELAGLRVEVAKAETRLEAEVQRGREAVRHRAQIEQRLRQTEAVQDEERGARRVASGLGGAGAATGVAGILWHVWHLVTGAGQP